MISSAEFDRRSKICISAPFRALVRGADASGERFTLSTTITHLSGCSVLVQLARPVLPGGSLFVVVELSQFPGEAVSPVQVAMRCTVRSIAARQAQAPMITAEFCHHRFVYAAHNQTD